MGKGHKPVEWRTPNGWWFVVVCETCGVCVTSIVSGGDALADFTRKAGQQTCGSEKPAFTPMWNLSTVTQPPSKCKFCGVAELDERGWCVQDCCGGRAEHYGTHDEE